MGVITAAEYFGNAIKQSITSNFLLDYRARFWLISADVGRTVFYPPVTEGFLPIGIHAFVVINVGTNTFTVRDTELVDTPISLIANKAIIASTVLDVTGGKRWCLDVGRNYSSY